MELGGGFPGGLYQTRVDRVGAVVVAGVAVVAVDLAVLVAAALVEVEQEEVINESRNSISFQAEFKHHNMQHNFFRNDHPY